MHTTYYHIFTLDDSVLVQAASCSHRVKQVHLLLMYSHLSVVCGYGSLLATTKHVSYAAATILKTQDSCRGVTQALPQESQESLVHSRRHLKQVTNRAWVPAVHF